MPNKSFRYQFVVYNYVILQHHYSRLGSSRTLLLFSAFFDQVTS